MSFHMRNVVHFFAFSCLIYFVSTLHITSESREKRALNFFYGGCVEPPDPPLYGKLKCHPTECHSKCDENYIFPNGESIVHFKCENGEWFIEDNLYESSPDCIKQCDLECFIDGVCIPDSQCPAKAKPGSCYTWAGMHFKTFDGVIYGFSGACRYILVEDIAGNNFKITLENNEGCDCVLQDTCTKVIKIFYEDKEFTLKQSAPGTSIVMLQNRTLAIPFKLPKLKVEEKGHYIIVTLINFGVKLKWNGLNFVQVDVDKSLWGKTGGLCGTLDGNSKNDMFAKDGEKEVDLITYLQSWQVPSSDSTHCKESPITKNPCSDNGNKQDEAHAFCKQLLSDSRFASCQKVTNIDEFLNSCTWSYCSCSKSDPKECICDTLDTYVKECISKGVTLTNWREGICPIKCPNGRIYKTCAPKDQSTCGDVISTVENKENCEEGCYCPEGTVLHQDKCIKLHECPCHYHGKEMPIGSTISKTCNTCTCIKGAWDCTTNKCTARCSSIGDPHYITFDGKRYDFMGHCMYYLVKNENFSIIAENVACRGTVEEMLSFGVTLQSDLPSCTKGVIIKFGAHTIKLSQLLIVLVDGRDILSFPHNIDDITILQGSSTFIIVQLPNGVEVTWDGQTNVYVDAPYSLKGQTQGLCGTFNNNQEDDFMTPDGTIVTNEISFGNKWKIDESCQNSPENAVQHPCDKNLKNKAPAQKNCKMIKSDIFSDCHWEVDPEPFYQECLYDVCSCELKLPRCFCPMIASYAAECARHGVYVEWRDKVKGCGIQCKDGQTFQSCVKPCSRTCSQLATQEDCNSHCVEGCSCPNGQAMNDQEECVPTETCACETSGIKYPAGYKEMRNINSTKLLCECMGAKWKCTPSKPDDSETYFNADEKSKCIANNQEFTPCKAHFPLTCRNMHHNVTLSPELCKPGCQCKAGYVIDTVSQKCIDPSKCPCYHGGRSYKEQDVVKIECNTCTCESGNWICTNKQCPGICSVWGNSHFNTFDDKTYNYHGQCDYVLSKGETVEGSFEVDIQNEQCGSLGESCTKSIIISASIADDKESVRLTVGKTLHNYSTYKYILQRTASQYVIFEIPKLEVTVTWDRQTRVNVKLGTQWNDKVEGLCGNYNGDSTDDFKNEDSVERFGDLWRLQPQCSETETITDSCENRPIRKLWGLTKCEVLNSETFSKCHSAVPVEPFVDNCVLDACACDQGDDCNCVCTALAAYAYECSRKGIAIKWRTSDLCPIQCDSSCSNYEPCISTCPVETCDNSLIYSKLGNSCQDEVCIEGCKIKNCPDGFIYLDSKLTECVPRNICKPSCMVVDGQTYYEGDIMEKDDCHVCYCSRGYKECDNQPCFKKPL